MNAILRKLDQMEERFDRLEFKFDGLESKVDNGFKKTGRSFMALIKPLEVHLGDEGTDASKELEEIWKDESA